MSYVVTICHYEHYYFVCKVDSFPATFLMRYMAQLKDLTKICLFY